MKFVSFRAGGAARYGLVRGNDVIDLSGRLKYPDLKALIAADAAAEAEREANGAKADFQLDRLTFDPVIPNPGKIICIGLNYQEHANETGFARQAEPPVFIRWADTQIGHLADVIRPDVSEQLDYEGELAAVIGKGGRHIREEDAAKHIFGYACYNEVSVRDYQRHASQFTPGKNFPATGAFGPVLVTADEVGALKGKKIQTRLNGETVQSSTLDMMISSPARLIAYLSSFTPLAPGDVIVTGTPSGVGWVRTPPLWMKPGDVTEVEIDGVGLLRNKIVAEERGRG
jgi:2-keto-4-pentenoate hydratase/2-oxohepta-3-ene-1,7-dioic acid hydratase in catechol pathway